MQKEVTLQAVLQSREERVQRQKKLMKHFHLPLVCLTMNIAGPVKISPLIRMAFEEGAERICALLGDTLEARIERTPETGYEGYYLFRENPEAVKRRLVREEDRDALGRLLDVDVLRMDGTKISREEVDLPARRCLLCSNQASACARSRSHPLSALRERTEEILSGYFYPRLADAISEKALRALLYEVSVSPKPGLVDRRNTGAHRDMDFFSFVDSALVLRPYFRECAMEGLRDRNGSEALLERLRGRGREAERDMLRATGGVNTHKGAIFSLGLLCAAAGMRYEAARPRDVCEAAAGLAQGTLPDLDAAGESPSHGEQLYRRYQIQGVRGEAAQGFPSVQNVGLPVLENALSRGCSANDAGVIALLHLISRVQDTNLIVRCGLEKAKTLQKELRAFLSGNPSVQRMIEKAGSLDEEWNRLGFSPGGCADLLSLCFFLHFLQA